MLTSSIQQNTPVSLKNVVIDNGFWGARQANNREHTLPAIKHQMEITGRVDAWKLDWKPGQPHKPHIFWDSDNGKWIEAAAYSLMTHPDAELETYMDSVIDLIAAAQQPDGYLNIFFTAVEPQNKFKNLRDWHEFYDAGHLVEGAVAYYEATGKRKLLDVMCRYIDTIDANFGPKEGQKRGYDGHPEAELALVKLYHATGEQRYLDLSKYFIDERGQQPLYFDQEAIARGEDPKQYWAKTYRYCQAHIPVREQDMATGHSVRAAYLYSGMADIAAETGDEALKKACMSIWDDLNEHHLYITGGLGPAHANEGFTVPYDLPNETAYAETCAAIALVFWAWRMFKLDPDSKYIDTMERALYNNVLSGVSHEGSHFFYANPLAAFPNVTPHGQWSGIVGDRDYRRSEWFDCACCPPNLARLVASLGGYIYSTDTDTLYVHLYASNHAEVEVNSRAVKISQQTDYPWAGQIRLGVDVDQAGRFRLGLRIPGWCRAYTLKVNGEALTTAATKGYVLIDREWKSGDEIILSLEMPVERVLPHPLIRHDAGNIALQRGPVVYCIEEADNGNNLANVIIPQDARMITTFEPDLFDGVSVINVEAQRSTTDWKGGLYQPESAQHLTRVPTAIKAIPYCFWANREPGEMRVWIREN
ncbi:MAG: glycoside hydrolase family 127 protein [Anaerolineae bacterium]|nr:glycoside hydrolase family 127 protein [Anaerolineae bacterium]